MANDKVQRTLILASALATGFALSACSGGGGTAVIGPSEGNPDVDGFELTFISVPEGAIWEINRQIEFGFSRNVDFASVNLNTITITDPAGLPANGEFFMKAGDTQTVIFQPTCPTQDDFGDSGFAPGGVTYEVRVLGEDAGGLAIQSLQGDPLKTSQSRKFETPTTLTSAILFVDPVVGPPSPVIRQVGSTDPTTSLELGGDSGTTVAFEFDPVLQAINQPADQPLNLYSDQSTQIAFIVEINQPVNPSSSNINSDNAFLEFEETPGSFRKISTQVELTRNCTESGATLRLTPLGVMPQASSVRAVLSPSFEDLVGERNLLPIDNFATVTTTQFSDPLLAPADDLADEIFEDFTLAGTDVGSNEDVDAAFAEPRALWGNGRLEASFDFSGDGGPGGDFDFLISDGETIFLDTTAATIFGGPQAFAGADSTFQTVINGRLRVRNLRIENGGELKAVGPNPLQIEATGTVEIFGLLNSNGADATNVATLNTGNQPEPGAAGQGGGGNGGSASFLTTTSTPKGGDAFGAFMTPGLGGVGGDSGFATGGKNNRRPGGGGGGRFGPDNGTAVGLIAEPGHNGNNNATSAITGTKPPRGGSIGASPFIDESTANDFFGVDFDMGTGVITVGELKSVHAGAGGGAGGDALPANQFPTPNWGPASDEKGCGGGGGAGGLLILALDDIHIGSGGRIQCNGGTGGAGENTIFNDHVGGGSGGGSGGHIILQGNRIDFTGSASNCIQARGGQSGAGQSGSNSTNAGGDGGPGIIQIHATDFVFGAGQTLANRTQPDAVQLSPLFGPISRARSKWLALGAVDVDPDGPGDQVSFFFDGTDTGTGEIRDMDTDGVVDDLPAILGPETVNFPPSTTVPFIDEADPRVLVVDVSATLAVGADDIYVRNPSLLKSFALELQETGNAANAMRFDIATATYDAATQLLTIVVDSNGPDLTSFTAPSVDFLILPRFFRVETDDTLDSLPTTATVQIMFQGASEDMDGDPDTSNILVDWTADISDLSVPSIAFYRFEVVFDIDAMGTGLSAESPRPALLFTRSGFRF